MKRWKRILSTLLVCCLVVGILPMTALAATDASGSCGTGVRWSYDSNSKTLTISGTGKMADYDHEWGENESPWYDSYRTEIETVVVESGVTRIGNEVFSGGAYRSGYPNLTSVSIADSVKEIGSYAFAGASSLTSLTLPSSLTTIGRCAFYGSGLEEITIPAGVNDIGSSAFAECNSLSAINVTSGNARYISDEGVLYEKLLGDGKSLLCYPVKKTASSYSVLAGTSEIAEKAFAWNTYLFSVTIPSTVRELPPMAFLFCTSLYTVSLPEGMSSVDSSAFWGCLVLSELHIPASVTNFTTQYTPADAWGGYVSNLSIYFSGSSAPTFDGGIAYLHGIDNTKVTIYYPTGSTGWSAVQMQEDVSSAVSSGAMEFQTWTPSSSGEPVVPPVDSNYAKIVRVTPSNGAADVGYDASNPPVFTITFDREISSMDTPNGFVFANLDFSKGTMKIFRESDDALIYEVTYDSYMNDFYDITGTTSSDIEVTNGNTITLYPLNAHTLLNASTKYYITVDEGFIRFEDGTTNPAIKQGDWEFTTAAAEYFSTKENITIKASDDIPEVAVSTTWDDSWFVNPATTYNHELAITSMALSGAAYVETANGNPSSASIQAALKSFGFDEIKSYNYGYPLSETDNDHVAFTFAVKRIKYITDDTTYLVAIVIKGTSENEEWYSNFNIGTGNIHAGFYLAKAELMNYLEDYLSYLGLDSSYKNSTKFLVTGHSRGAAVANLVAADLSYSSHATRSNVYGYTFATPAVAATAGVTSESAYNNIFNIINGEDFVTQIPLSKWDYGRYGIDLALPSRSYYGSGYDTLYTKMCSAYRSLTTTSFKSFNGTQAVDSVKAAVYQLAPTVKAFYTDKHDISGTLLFKTTTTNEYFQIIADILVNGVGFSNGLETLLSSNQSDFAGITWFFMDNHEFNQKIFSAHGMAGYYSWLSTCTAQELFGSANESTYKTFKRITVACPVNVYVYDEDGTLVASVENEEPIVNTLAVNVEDSVKVIDLPSDQEYSIKIVATDDGSVDYTVEEWSAEGIGDSVLRTVEFYDIDIADGDVLTGEVNDTLYTAARNYALTKNEDTVIYADYDSYIASSSGNHSSTGSSASSSYAISTPAVNNGTITISPKSASKDTTVTITATPDDGYELDTLTAIDAKGNELTLTDKGNGTYTFIMPASQVTVTASFAEIKNKPEPVVTPFADVFERDYYYDAVLWAVENGITYGTSATTFSPDLACTRAQIVTFLWRAAGSPEPVGNHNPFTDVKASDYYYEAVLWAVENSVTEGTSTTTFSPDLACTRAQAVTFLWRAAGKPAPVSSVNPFTDVKSGQYYTDAVLWAAENGITEGTSATTFSPGLTCTRAQIVTFLYRNKK